MVAPATPPPNTVPINSNRIGGSFSTYSVDQSPFGKKNSLPQPSTNRANQFTPAGSVPFIGGGGGGFL
jgi:hypothetical protein